MKNFYVFNLNATVHITSEWAVDIKENILHIILYSRSFPVGIFSRFSTEHYIKVDCLTTFIFLWI